MAEAAVVAVRRAASLLREVDDILVERVERATPPSWCERREWTPFLLSLGGRALDEMEARGLAPAARDLPGAPRDLVELARAVDEITALPVLAVSARRASSRALRAVRERKRPQLERLLGAVAGMTEHAARIVDVGAGSGHFTRLALRLLERDAIGIDRDRARIDAAAARAAEDGESVVYESRDLLSGPLALSPTDLAVGLHACGELGDAIVRAAVEARCPVALVSCCAQKIRSASRTAISRAAGDLALRREVLGLANLTIGPRGVEVDLAATLEARRTRHALRRLLAERGVVVAAGEEMRGINRRRARLGLFAIAAVALGSRGLTPPTEAELTRHDEASHHEHLVMRKLSLPRNMLARVVEVALALDRAAALEECGHAVVAGTIFDASITPRNIAVLATPN